MKTRFDKATEWLIPLVVSLGILIGGYIWALHATSWACVLATIVAILGGFGIVMVIVAWLLRDAFPEE